ncbi:hypothetical protein OSTOST_09214, partial [Ostertagia ostertagi]
VSIDTFVDRFIDHAKKLASKRKSGQEEKLINNIKAAVRQLADERRRIQLCDGCQVLKLLEAQNETFKSLSISSRWTHCSLLLLKHLLKSEQITKNGSVLSSTVFVRELVYDWMLQAATFDTFGAVITVIENLSLNDLIEKFLNEYASEDIVLEEQRAVLTWKCISLTRVVDSRRSTRILHELAAAWPKKRGFTAAADLITSVHHLVGVARNHPNVAKTCITLFKVVF